MNLKIELAKWTRAAAGIASCGSKKTKNRGNSIVPKPKPEKKVRVEPNRAIMKVRM